MSQPAAPARSGLYLGAVTHSRLRPVRHALRYKVFQLVLDLDEAPSLARRLGLFAFNAGGLISFQERDHGDRDGSPLRLFVNRTLAEAGEAACEGRILIQCMPRVLGYVFNPLSLYYCFDPEERLSAVVLQVHNTFGQRHAYVLPATVETGGERAVRGGCAKAFHVSPFMGMDLDYRFDLRPPGARVRSVVQVLDRDGEMVLHADFTGERRELSDRALAGALLRRPLLTLKVVAAIHLEAVRLMLKGLRLLPKPPPPLSGATLARGGA